MHFTLCCLNIVITQVKEIHCLVKVVQGSIIQCDPTIASHVINSTGNCIVDMIYLYLHIMLKSIKYDKINKNK